jgi:hypothetical protein
MSAQGGGGELATRLSAYSASAWRDCKVAQKMHLVRPDGAVRLVQMRVRRGDGVVRKYTQGPSRTRKDTRGCAGTP